MKFEDRLREQATKSLDVTELIITSGVEVPVQQMRTALAVITGELKSEANRTRQMAQMISLTRFAVRDAVTRERIALSLMAPLLPDGTIAIGPVLSTRPELSGDDSVRR